jgi:hypothetical protein
MAFRSLSTMMGKGLNVCGSDFGILISDFCIQYSPCGQSLAAVAGRRSTPFHGADGADALQNAAAT